MLGRGALLRHVEPFDDRIRKAREIVECFNDVYASEGTGLIKRYQDGQLHLGLRYTLPQERDYGFIVSADVERCGHNHVTFLQTKGAHSDPLRVDLHSDKA